MPIYNPDIPQPNDNPRNSQDQILQNFQSIQNAFGLDHVSLTFGGSAAQIGKHDHVTMPVQTSPADPPTIAGETVLYTKNDTNGVPNLFWRAQSNGNIVQLTGLNSSSGANGFTFLPGDLLMQWGTVNLLVSQTAVVNFPQAYSAVPYSLVGTQNSASPSATPNRIIEFSSITTSQFTIKVNLIPCTIAWIAIGPQ